MADASLINKIFNLKQGQRILDGADHCHGLFSPLISRQPWQR